MVNSFTTPDVHKPAAVATEDKCEMASNVKPGTDLDNDGTAVMIMRRRLVEMVEGKSRESQESIPASAYRTRW